jgi:hypothetical protein
LKEIEAADQSNFIINVGTGPGTDTENGVCNIPNSHAYSLLAVFNLTAANGTIIPALMIRNPWGT